MVVFLDRRHAVRGSRDGVQYRPEGFFRGFELEFVLEIVAAIGVRLVDQGQEVVQEPEAFARGAPVSGSFGSAVSFGLSHGSRRLVGPRPEDDVRADHDAPPEILCLPPQPNHIITAVAV